LSFSDLPLPELRAYAPALPELHWLAERLRT
jgi:hypothetical protein